MIYNEHLFDAYRKATTGEVFCSGICSMPVFCKDPFVRWATVKTVTGWVLRYVFDDMTLDEIKSKGDTMKDKRVAQEITHCTPAMLRLYHKGG